MLEEHFEAAADQVGGKGRPCGDRQADELSGGRGRHRPRLTWTSPPFGTISSLKGI